MKALIDTWMTMYEVYILTYAIAPTERQIKDNVCYERGLCDQKCKGITCEQTFMNNNPVNHYNPVREAKPHVYADEMSFVNTWQNNKQHNLQEKYVDAIVQVGDTSYPNKAVFHSPLRCKVLRHDVADALQCITKRNNILQTISIGTCTSNREDKTRQHIVVISNSTL